MFTPFQKDVLNREPFLKSQVKFDLFNKMLEGDLDVALMTEDQNVVAMCNAGRPMWLWVNEELSGEAVDEVLNELCMFLREKKLHGVSAIPSVSEAFTQKYSNLLGITSKLSMGLESYECPEVKVPYGVRGKMILSEPCHTEIIAEFCVGFILDGYGKEVTVESQIPTAQRLVESGNLYLWVKDDEVVTMANIAHRSTRQARINNVYTPPGQRKKGYASALVAEMSSMLLKEGLMPILFADLENPGSNKVYKNIGYVECGKIQEYVFKY